MGRPTKISTKETFQRKNGCKRSFLPCLRLCLYDSCNKPTVPTNNEVPTNQVPTNAPSSWRISRDNEVPTDPPNQVPTNATCSWRISQDNEVPTDPPHQVPTNDQVPTNQVPTSSSPSSSWRISQGTLRMHQPLPWETQCIQGRPRHPLWAPGTRGLLRRLQR